MDAVSASTDSIASLRRQLTGNSILTGDDIGARYSVDFTGENGQMPIAVIRPGSTEEVSLVLKTCSEFGQQVVVQGGLTGLAGGATPRPGEIALSLLDETVDKLCGRFVNLFPECLQKTIESLRKHKLNHWDRNRESNRAWLGLNMMGEAKAG